jgi:cyclophilin family peptidyl-prolyl cis-trans isomerase
LHSLPVETQPDSASPLTADGKVHGWGLYCPGVAGMARDEGNDTANSQFFLMRQAYPALDKRYTIWGVTVSGLDVVRSLQVGRRRQRHDDRGPAGPDDPRAHRRRHSRGRTAERAGAGDGPRRASARWWI